VRRTTDGGRSWADLPVLRTGVRLYGLSFPGRKRGWVVGEGGTIARYAEP